MILAVAVGVPSQLTGKARARAQTALTNVHAAAAAVVLYEGTIYAPISAAAEVGTDTRERGRAQVREWARLNVRAGPGAARVQASARREIKAAVTRATNARLASSKAVGKTVAYHEPGTTSPPTT